MDSILSRFKDAAGFDAEQLVPLISIGAIVFVTLWACWCVLGQFKLWSKGDIHITDLFFGSMRVVGVVMAVSIVLSFGVMA